MAAITPKVATRFTAQPSRKFFFKARYYGGSPQMPIIGTQGWQSMLSNLRAQQRQPSLSRADILNNQRLSAIESELREIKEMMSKIVESNEQTQKSLKGLQHKYIAIKQLGNS